MATDTKGQVGCDDGEEALEKGIQPFAMEKVQGSDELPRGKGGATATDPGADAAFDDGPPRIRRG